MYRNGVIVTGISVFLTWRVRYSSLISKEGFRVVLCVIALSIIQDSWLVSQSLWVRERFMVRCHVTCPQLRISHLYFMFLPFCKTELCSTPSVSLKLQWFCNYYGILWCIFMEFGHIDPWIESHKWPQQTWGQRSSRGQWPWVQVFEKGSLYPHTLTYFHVTWIQWSLGRVTHVTSTVVGQRSSRGIDLWLSFWKIVTVSTYFDVLPWKLDEYYNDCKSMWSRKQARLIVQEPPCW